MRAIVQQEFGPASVLVTAEAPLPMPAEGQVRVRVEAAGVHAVDTGTRRGDGPPSMPRPELPMIPGREIAGVVDAVGPSVDERLIGERVVAHLGFLSGGYAEYALAPASALHLLPQTVPFSAAVAAIGTGRTAQLVLEKARLTADDVVLVPGASGGLGNHLTQLALALGCTVVALYGGAAKQGAVADIPNPDGRLLTIDVTESDWVQRMRGALQARDAPATVLIDGVGGEIGRSALETLAPGGRAVIIGSASGTPLAVTTDDLVNGSLTVGSVLGQPVGELRALERRALTAVADGQVRPLIDEYPLAAAAAAHEAIEQRRSRGKVVLLPLR
ncbi:zinc-binding dehydrogenase [Diaminobutyricimonas sp. TR449]|uniref:alcohol dehydrogenase catalytic domain-containing protein n=1 Tax=Diaminobutyricimonas sp. TR449 TaxID=2708076 RepID=UPI0014243E4A|nr:zinc-binding dehydrogenase [Diaminobutyricimonas sp. TR449]